MRQYTKTKLVIQHTKDYTCIDGIFFLSIIKQIGLYKFIKKTTISRKEDSHYYSRCGFTLKSFSGQKRYYQQGSI